MIDLTVKTLDSQNHAFSLEDDQITVRGFKEYIAESVAVPADSQRLIYCGRVLQDEKKLNDYDVNGKVIHLVQRAPPQPGQRNNDNGQTQGQNHPQGWPNPQRTHYRLTRAQMHGNALYLGAVAGPPLPPVPPEIVEGHGLPFTTLSNPLAVSRLAMVRRMLDRVNELLTVLQDPASPINPPQPEPTPSTTSHQEQPQEVETDQEHNNNARADNLPEASAIAIAAALSAIDHNVILLRRDVNGTETQSAAPESEPQPEARSLPLQQPQPQAQPQPQPQPQPQSQPQSQPQPQPQPQPPQEPPSEEGSTSTSEGPANRRGAPQAGWTPQVADVLQRLISTHDSLRPFLERYTNLMRTDPVLPPGPGPAGVEDSQRIVDGVSECLHFMSHACHSLSDIIVDMAQQPPRNLRCRPTYIQHSVVLQSGIPIQVEAHISVHGRNSNNNVANEESSEASTGTGTGGSTERNGESSTQQNDSDSANQQTSGQQQQPQQPQQPQEGQTQSPFGAVFNLPNNVEVLMEVSPEGNIDAPARSEQNQSEETNNNNSHGARINGSGMFPWGATPPPDFIRNLMQVVAGHVVQSGINTTTLTTRNPPSTGTGQQPHGTSDNGSTNSGQSTQARSNVGTHPTTATQTRSTSRPHIFHQQAHPLGVGMAIGQELFDPFLPCNSRHIRQPSNAPGSTVTATSQGTRGGQTSTSETQAQSQSASASIGTNGASTANAASPPVSQRTPPNSLVNLLQEMFGSAIAQSDEDTEINHHDMTASEFVRSIIDIVGEHDTQDGAAAGGAGRSGPPLLSRRSTMAEFLASVGVYMDVLSIADPMVASNFLGNLMVFLVQNITLEGLDRLWTGHGEPIVQLRRPFHEFIQACFQNSSPEEIQEQTLHTILTQLRPHLQSLQAKEEVFGRPSHSQRVDIAATVESLLRRHIGDILRNVFNTEVNDTRFEQEVLGSFRNLGRQLCAVLRYSVRGGEVGLDRLVSNFVPDILSPIFCIHDLRFFMVDVIKVFVSIICRSLCVSQPPDAEIIPLLVYKDAAHQTTPASSAPTEQSTTQEAPEPMETEAVDERTTYEAAAPDDTEEITETFPGHQVLPPDWMPIIARDSVRQRRQLQTQGMVSGRVTTFSDAYLGALPTKRRKIIEQQKSRLLVSPTPNHSAITTSMERLIREGVSRAGIEEVEGAAVAAAADPGVRRAFGQAIRDCLHPHRYETPDFPDPLRFPNASKYFAEQDRPPK